MSTLPVYVTVANDRAVVRHGDDLALDHAPDAASCEACPTCVASQGW